MIIAVGKNMVTGRGILYVGLSEENLLSLMEENSPIMRALDGSGEVDDQPTTGLEDWELVVLGPVDSISFADAVRVRAAEE